MSLFKRVQQLFSNPDAEPPKQEPSILDLQEGDIAEISLVTYEVIGKVIHQHRHAIVLTLKDGQHVRYLYVEERENDSYALYAPIDGRLDSIDEIPATIEMDGTSYYLEEEYNGPVTASGRTPFSSSSPQYVWQFQSDNHKLLRIEWQDGRIIMFEGETIPRADVSVIKRN